MSLIKEKVQIEEVRSVLIPAEGVSLDDAIKDAELAGFQMIEIDRINNRAVIVWYKKPQPKNINTST